MNKYEENIYLRNKYIDCNRNNVSNDIVHNYDNFKIV